MVKNVEFNASNVKKLLSKKRYNGEKPLAYIRNQYRTSGGMHVTARLCYLLRSLLPQSRCRAICLGTKHAAPQGKEYFDILRMFQRRRHFGWSKCLVGCDSGHKPQGNHKKKTKWVPKHDDWATQNGLHDLDAQAKRLSKLKQCKPKWHPVCTPRERSLLLLHSEKLTRSGIDVRKTKRLLQIDQEVDRSYPKDEYVGCMTPAAKVHDLQEDICLSPLAKAAFQGFDAETLKKYGFISRQFWLVTSETRSRSRSAWYGL